MVYPRKLSKDAAGNASDLSNYVEIDAKTPSDLYVVFKDETSQTKKIIAAVSRLSDPSRLQDESPEEYAKRMINKMRTGQFLCGEGAREWTFSDPHIREAPPPYPPTILDLLSLTGAAPDDN